MIHSHNLVLLGPSLALNGVQIGLACHFVPELQHKTAVCVQLLTKSDTIYSNA
jgi:hypothetical protein